MCKQIANGQGDVKEKEAHDGQLGGEDPHEEDRGLEQGQSPAPPMGSEEDHDCNIGRGVFPHFAADRRKEDASPSSSTP